MTDEERLNYIYNDDIHINLMTNIMQLDMSLLSVCPMEKLFTYKSKIDTMREYVISIYTDYNNYNEEVKKQLYSIWMDLLDLEGSHRLVCDIKMCLDNLITWAEVKQELNGKVHKKTR